ncbi:MAG: flagellar hook-length control protein FliK [Candidatus Pristimantibacillus sp.]
MELSIPQASLSNSASVQGNNGTQAKASNGSNGTEFQQALVYQIKGNSTASGSATAQSSTAAQQTVVTTEVVATDLLTSEEAVDLMALIEGLLDELQESEQLSTDTDEKSKLTELEAMLDQLNALMALLGIPAIKLSQSAPVEGLDDNADVTNQQLTAVKNGLQDSLMQLQSHMQEGSLKLVQQQEPTQLIGQQLQAIQHLLQKHKESGSNVNAEQSSSASDDFVPVPVSNQTTATASVLLQRLSQQAANPSLLSTLAEDALAKGSVESAPVESAEQAPVSQQGVNFGDLLRSTSQSTPKVVLQPYVLADQFADSMSDMIVQKFNITALNGVTEAKIQLFPEQLGQVDVRITMQNGILTAMFQTDTANAKDVLDNQMAQLRLALQAQGLAVDKLEVTQGQVASQLSNGHQGQGTGQQFTTNQNKSKTDGISDDGFEPDTIEQIAIQDLGFGRAVNVTA